MIRVFSSCTRASSVAAVLTARLETASSADCAVAYLLLNSVLVRLLVCSASLSLASASATCAR
jgi:hypothetical protein